jgi:ligand-binding sensor domain-containing protein
VGLFDGGLLAGELKGDGLSFQSIPGASTWGVNALLSSGGELHIASLRGASRLDGQRMRAVDGPGAAFSLTETADGVAIGYAQGAWLPGAGLLSAFHGLPGNQALALEAGPELLVGTPTGLGAISGRKVLWRITAGEGRLPHPWVTSLARDGSSLFVGTFGGGIARRRSGSTPPAKPLSDNGIWSSFPETAGLKISAGALVTAGGRVFAGTDGSGVWATDVAKDRFEKLDLVLPSPRVTALLVDGGTLWIGTDEGLTRMAIASGVGE